MGHIGLIFCTGRAAGIGICTLLCPPPGCMTRDQLLRLPATAAAALPFAKVIAFSGRLPGLVHAAGGRLEAPICEGSR